MEVYKTGKPMTTVELGRGGFAIRGIAPIFIGDSLVGSVEMYYSPLDIKRIIDREDAKSGIFFILEKAKAEKLFFKEEIEQKYKYSVGDYYATDPNQEWINPELILNNEIIEKATESGLISGDLIDDYSVSYIPLKDFTGNVIGQIVFVKDFGEEIATSKETVLLINLLLVLIVVVFGLLIIVILRIYVNKPLKSVGYALQSISTGDFDYNNSNREEILKFTNTKNKDEIGELSGYFNQTISSIKNLMNDVNELSDSAVNGNLDKRADDGKYKGEYRSLVTGVNGLLDAVISPLNVTAEYVDRISKGDIPPKITDDYKGDFNEIKNNLNQLIDNLDNFVNQMNHMSKEHDLGDIDVIMNEDTFHGAYREMASGVNNMVNGHISVKKKAMACFMEFGNGNLDAEVEQFPGKKAFINDTIEKVRKNIKALIEDANILAVAARDGKLDTRADASKHQGDYRRIVQGINDTLDNVIGPLNVTAEYVDRISKGDIPPVITDEYSGDFNEIKTNLNALINATNQASELAVAISNGDLSSEVNIRSDNDELMIALSRMKDAISSVAEDTIELATLAAGGQIEKRAEADKYKGEYYNIINGVNQTLQAVTNVLNTSSNIMIADVDGIIRFMNKPVISLLSKYESNIRQQYPDFAVSKLVGRNIDSFHKNPQHNRSLLTGLSDASHTAIISIGDQIFKLVVSAYHNSAGDKLGYVVQWNNITNERLFEEELANLIETVTAGDLSASIDAEKLEGNLHEISTKINQMLGLILNPINETIDVLQKMSEGNFSVQVRGDYKGDHAKLKNAINTTIDMLPINETIRILEAMADGDLTKEMKGKYKGDALKLKNSLNSTIESINEILAQVKATVEEVNRGAMQVADASNSLSQGATEQAASLEEITSSMGEIGSQTKTNAENANQANILANQAKQSAESGNNEMGQLNKAMSEISESSANISKIIKVIDEIAFQTNLLALNAAVEAARAGRHGKGFAVVAEEVRNLAGRSASAAKETAEMIENTIKRVENGSLLAGKTADVLEEIKNGNIKAADIVAEIATASSEQAQGISQINEGLNQIDKVTQTNTASAEESASASEELSGQARLLREMVMKFNLRKDIELDLDNDALMSKSRGGRALSDGRNEQETESYTPSSHDEDADDPNDFINLDEDDFGKY
jgi:methyl-accepting chemotaxis protein